MTIKEKEKNLRMQIMNKIISQIKNLPKFLKEEIQITLEYLNYYKLKKLLNEINIFINQLKQIVSNYRKEVIYFYKLQLKGIE